MTKRTKMGIGGAAALVLLAGVAVMSRFQRVAVCRHCGALQHEIRWQLPLNTGWSYWIQQRVEETPLSRMLAKSGHVAPHGHLWMSIHGSGNGVKCALGYAGSVYGTAYDPAIAERLERLEGGADPTFFRQVIHAVLCPDSAREMRMTLYDFPAEGPVNPGVVAAWKQRNQSELDKAFEAARQTRDEDF